MRATLGRMRRVLVIGIGAGDPEHLTVQAIRAMRQVDVFFLLDKGVDARRGGPGAGGGDELVRFRRELCARYLVGHPHRFVEAPDPERDRRPAGAAGYAGAVRDWHQARADLVEQLLARELDEDGCGAFLVWGDPSLYDSTLRVLDEVAARGEVPFEHEVVPGITSVQVLAARHRVALHRVGDPVHITTGRRLAATPPADIGDVTVMLDAGGSFAHAVDEDLEIFWGAYLGTPDELLVSGPLGEVAGEIQRLRAEARARKGWVMDTYLLRRRPPRGRGGAQREAR